VALQTTAASPAIGDLGKAYYLQTLSFDEGDAAKVGSPVFLFVISLIKNKPKLIAVVSLHWLPAA
jgi:hypothetical protein